MNNKLQCDYLQYQGLIALDSTLNQCDFFIIVLHLNMLQRLKMQIARFMNFSGVDIKVNCMIVNFSVATDCTVCIGGGG